MITLILWLATISCAFSAQISKCSTQNTGSSVKSSLFMSNSLCINSCGGYGFAIVSNENCYCSNYAPGSTSDTENCAADCPGFPSEQCAGNGFFAYIEIGSVSGTRAASSSTSSTAASSSSSSSSSASSSAQSSTDTTSVVIETVSSSLSAVLVTSTSTAHPTNSRGETVTSIMVVTQSNPKTTVILRTSTLSNDTDAVVTRFVTGVTSSPDATSLVTSIISNTNTINSDASSVSSTSANSPGTSTSSAGSQASSDSSPKNKSFWDSPGKVGGTFACVGLIILVLIALLIFALMRHRYNKHLISPSQSGLVTDSVNGSLGGSPIMEKNQRYISAGDSIIPVPVVGEFDSRLDPSQMFNHNIGLDEESKRSVSDENDYSRKFLTVANPDLMMSKSNQESKEEYSKEE